jgi:hypothetical protein
MTEEGEMASSARDASTPVVETILLDYGAMSDSLVNRHTENQDALQITGTAIERYGR